MEVDTNLVNVLKILITTTGAKLCLFVFVSKNNTKILFYYNLVYTIEAFLKITSAVSDISPQSFLFYISIKCQCTSIISAFTLIYISFLTYPLLHYPIPSPRKEAFCLLCFSFCFFTCPFFIISIEPEQFF